MRFLAKLGRIFPRSSQVDTVKTTYRMVAPPESIWSALMFYEEVPQRAPLLLRLFLPSPIRTRGDKTRVGEKIECVYDGGYLEKEIAQVAAARFVSFDVLVQRLGVEDCITMGSGSYDLIAADGGTDVVLTTHYCGHLRPRWLWRPLERYLGRTMHRHILDAMRDGATA